MFNITNVKKRYVIKRKFQAECAAAIKKKETVHYYSISLPDVQVTALGDTEQS